MIIFFKTSYLLLIDQFTQKLVTYVCSKWWPLFLVTFQFWTFFGYISKVLIVAVGCKCVTFYHSTSTAQTKSLTWKKGVFWCFRGAAGTPPSEPKPFWSHRHKRAFTACLGSSGRDENVCSQALLLSVQINSGKQEHINTDKQRQKKVKYIFL